MGSRIECGHCGGPMMRETVIKLQRRFLGFRETRSQGAFCAVCRIAVPIEPAAQADTRPPAITTRTVKSLKRRFTSWHHATPSPSGAFHPVHIPIAEPMPLVR